MNLLPFKGFMIPGIHFDKCCIWVLNWPDAPTQQKKMTEVWLLNYDGTKTCYIDPKESISVLEKYHSFEQIIPATINVIESPSGIMITIIQSDKELLSLEIERKSLFRYRLINWFITHCKQISNEGLTETGKFFQNIPHHLSAITIKKAILLETKLQLIRNPKIAFDLGDGKPTDTPIINYCTHMLEE